MIKWSTKRRVLIGTIEIENFGTIEVFVKKSIGGMNFEARFMTNTVIGHYPLKEEAIQACEDYINKLGI